MAELKRRASPIDVNWGPNADKTGIILEITGLDQEEANRLGQALRPVIRDAILRATRGHIADVQDLDPDTKQPSGPKMTVICMCPVCIEQRARGIDARTEPGTRH